MVLYLLTNTVNGKQYVGITKLFLEERWVNHQKTAKRDAQYAISRAIRKYGAAVFTLTVLAESDSWDVLCTMERDAIVQYNTHIVDGHGYNMTRGGDGRLGWQLSDEAKATIGRKNRGRKRTPRQQARVNEALPRGENHHMRRNPPTAQQMAVVHAGREKWRATKRVNSAETRKKISQGLRGHTFTEETKRKIAATLRGRTPWNKGKKTGPTGKPSWNTGKSSSRVAQTLAMPTARARRCRPIVFEGVEYGSIKEACIKTGFSRSTFYQWLLSGKARYVKA